MSCNCSIPNKFRLISCKNRCWKMRAIACPVSLHYFVCCETRCKNGIFDENLDSQDLSGFAFWQLALHLQGYKPKFHSRWDVDVVTIRITAWFHETVYQASRVLEWQFRPISLSSKDSCKVFRCFGDTPSIEISSYLRSVSPTPETTVTMRHQIKYVQREFPSFAAGCPVAAMRRLE